MNVVSVCGNLVAEPNLRLTPNGKSVVSFRVAVSRRINDEDRTDFIDCTAWGGLAEHIAETLAKGDRVIVVGRLSVQRWQRDDGTYGERWEIVADDVGASLLWASGEVHRVRREARDA